MPPLIDISLPLSSALPIWPGSRGIAVERVMQIGASHDANVTYLAMDVHVGTHVEAPAHFLERGAPLDALALGTFIGPAAVLDCRGIDVITASDLARAHIPDGITRVLFRTGNSDQWQATLNEFRSEYVALTCDAAAWLVEHKFQLVGIDAISIAEYAHCADVHRILMAGGVAILEGLDLRAAPPGDYTLIALPLHIPGAEAAPVRAVLLPLHSDHIL